MSYNNTTNAAYCEEAKLGKLDENQEKAVREFLAQSCAQPSGSVRLKALPEPQRRALALKFLRARKWEVTRAAELFRAHERLRRGEGFEHIDPCDSGVRAELLSEKFTVLSDADPASSVVALFTACHHHPPETTHRDTLKSLIFQLDAALAVDSAQENGLLFVYDMTASKYSNFDYDLSIKILNMLKGNYPARLKKVLIVTAPIWFKAPFQVLRMFVREKLRDRVFTVDRRGLCTHLPPHMVPRSLGGTRTHDHQAWLVEACRRMGRCLPSDYFHQQAATTLSAAGGGALAPSAASDASSLADEPGGSYSSGGSAADWMADCSVSMTDSVAEAAVVCSRKRSPSVDAGGTSGDSPSKKRSGVDGGDRGNDQDGNDGAPTLAEFAARVAALQREGLVAEFNRELGPDRGGDRPCEAFKRNREKNRYSDVPCLDASRVRLQGRQSDYVHANWVDGYQQPGAYICTQGPLAHTVPDFWAMVWQNGVGVIVMTTRLIESRRPKCTLYWPQAPGEAATFGQFSVACESVQDDGDLVSTELTVSYGDSRRRVTHLQFTSWPDFGIPHAAGAFLRFLERVRSAARERGGPVLVHCSAGIGRSGTFVTVDVALRRLMDTQQVDLLGTVRKLRDQRAGSIQTAEQYVFCHIALLEYAASQGMLPAV